MFFKLIFEYSHSENNKITDSVITRLGIKVKIELCILYCKTKNRGLSAVFVICRFPALPKFVGQVLPNPARQFLLLQSDKIR